MFTFPPPHPLPAHSEAHSHRLPWAGRSPARFGVGWKLPWALEETGRRGRAAGGAELAAAGDASRRRTVPAGAADEPPLPPTCLGRHKCVSLRVRWLSWHYKQRNHSPLPQQHQLGPWCAVTWQPVSGPRGWRGTCCTVRGRTRVLPAPGPMDASLYPHEQQGFVPFHSPNCNIIFFYLYSNFLTLSLGSALHCA